MSVVTDRLLIVSVNVYVVGFWRTNKGGMEEQESWHFAQILNKAELLYWLSSWSKESFLEKDIARSHPDEFSPPDTNSGLHP